MRQQINDFLVIQSSFSTTSRSRLRDGYVGGWRRTDGARRGGDDGRGGTASSSSLLQPYGDG